MRKRHRLVGLAVDQTTVGPASRSRLPGATGGSVAGVHRLEIVGVEVAPKSRVVATATGTSVYPLTHASSVLFIDFDSSLNTMIFQFDPVHRRDPRSCSSASPT